MRFVRVVAAALLLGTMLLAAPGAAPLPVRGLGTLPKCELLDVLTIPRSYDDWSTTLVDWLVTVGPDYKPPDLVSVRDANIAGGGYIRKVAINDLRAMAAAAKKHGTPIVVYSPYRGYKQQVKLFNGYAGWNSKTETYSNYDSAVNYSQRPGHSEHQLGLAIDFIAVGDSTITRTWESTPTGSWMAEHAWEFGWLMSYPRDKFDIVCFNYEPWHYRYVGRQLAKKIHESGVTIREYLWANFTQLDTTFQPVPTATVAPAATPSAAPSPANSIGEPSPSATQWVVGPSPTTTPAPAAGAAAWFGVDPAVVIAGVLLVVAFVALAFSLRRARAAS